MSHEKWDDNKIEQLLSNAPKVHDQRSKEEVLQRLKNDGLFDDEAPSKTKGENKKKKRNWIPAAVTIAAVGLLAILVPSIMNNSNAPTEEASSTMTTESVEDTRIFNTEESSDIANEGASTRMFSAESAIVNTAVYPEEIAGFTVFSIGLVSNDADSVPVTLLIPNERITEDFGDTAPTKVQLYNRYAPLLDETSLGFVEYHPYKGEISENGSQVIHTLPSNHQYDTASATLSIYQASLVDTFREYEEVVFLNEDGSPVTFSQVGESSDSLQLHGENTQYNYFKYVQEDGSQYLVPNFRETFSTVDEAIQAMKMETNDIYQSAILPNVDFETRVQGDIVTVVFSTEMDFMSVDQKEAMQMVEGILLTAASFDMQVQFENVVQTEWGGFNFTQPLPMPVGPNEVPLLLTE